MNETENEVQQKKNDPRETRKSNKKNLSGLKTCDFGCKIR
jgi:hypothetical protein